MQENTVFRTLNAINCNEHTVFHELLDPRHFEVRILQEESLQPQPVFCLSQIEHLTPHVPTTDPYHSFPSAIAAG